MNKLLTPVERLELLSRPIWSYKEIGMYFNCGTNKAIDIKKAAMVNGKVKYNSDVVTIDSVFSLLGISRQAELEIVYQSAKVYVSLVNITGNQLLPDRAC